MEPRHHFHHVRSALQTGGFQVLDGFPHMMLAALLVLPLTVLLLRTFVVFARWPVVRARVAELALQTLHPLADLVQLTLQLLVVLACVRWRSAFRAARLRATPLGRWGRRAFATRFGGAAFWRATGFGAGVRRPTLTFTLRLRLGLRSAHLLPARRGRSVRT